MNKTLLISIAGMAFACFAATASADTILNSGAIFNMDAANWGNNAPTSGVNGVISGDYVIGGNVSLSGRGAFSVTQTAGAGTGGQWNYHSNADYTFNLNGGTLENTSGIFFVNGTTFNVGGGTLTALDFRLQNAGIMTVSSGNFTASIISLRGGTFNQSGGILTSNHGGPVFNRGSTSSMINLSGGNIIAGTGNNNALVNNTGLMTTIGGGLTADLPAAVNLFSGGTHGNSSTINFTSDWTGSLILNSATAWDGIFEAGDVSVDGVELGANDFEIHFVNNNGVITAIPEPATLGLMALMGASILFIRRRFMM